MTPRKPYASLRADLHAALKARSIRSGHSISRLIDKALATDPAYVAHPMPERKP